MHKQINVALEGMMKWNPSLRVGISKNNRGKYEMKEDLTAKPRLLCYYNQQDWKKVLQIEIGTEIKIEIETP